MVSYSHGEACLVDITLVSYSHGEVYLVDRALVFYLHSEAYLMDTTLVSCSHGEACLVDTTLASYLHGEACLVDTTLGLILQNYNILLTHLMLILKMQSKNVADDNFSFFFSQKKRLDISCESSVFSYEMLNLIF